MKITGKRLLNQVLGGWDFEDYRPSNNKVKQNTASRKWSKKLRNRLKIETKKEIKLLPK